jgi:hypothetical protein
LDDPLPIIIQAGEDPWEYPQWVEIGHNSVASIFGASAKQMLT